MSLSTTLPMVENYNMPGGVLLLHVRNGHDFIGAIPRVMQLLALQKRTPDRNAERMPLPGVWLEEVGT